VHANEISNLPWGTPQLLVMVMLVPLWLFSLSALLTWQHLLPASDSSLQWHSPGHLFGFMKVHGVFFAWIFCHRPCSSLPLSLLMKHARITTIVLVILEPSAKSLCHPWKLSPGFSCEGATPCQSRGMQTIQPKYSPVPQSMVFYSTSCWESDG
jgi:hypothetical protein